MIKAVIFDYGNVISLPQTGKIYQIMQEKTGVPAEIFSSSFFTYRKSFDLGEINGAQLYKNIFLAHGYENYANDLHLCEQMARIDMDSWKDYNKQVSHWALDLQKQGLKLGVLSNMPYEFLDNFEKTIPVFTHADFAVFSCRVKMQKPDAEIYQYALNGLRISSEQAVFFDDLPENIEAANKLGIHGILWTTFDAVKSEFEKCYPNFH